MIAEEVDSKFSWVDVACIDQNAGSAEGAKEVGRQARIFRSAYQTFVWLVRDNDDPDERSL
jgi:hypothetical protein